MIRMMCWVLGRWVAGMVISSNACNLLSLDAKMIVLFMLVSALISLISARSFSHDSNRWLRVPEHEWKTMQWAKLNIHFYCNVFSGDSDLTWTTQFAFEREEKKKLFSERTNWIWSNRVCVSEAVSNAKIALDYCTAARRTTPPSTSHENSVVAKLHELYRPEAPSD